MEINEQIKILIEQFKNGNKDSFVEIINLVREPVYKIIYTIVNNKENAIDILDEVIYKSYTNLHTLKQSEYFKTWIIRIAINESKNYLKKNSKVIYIEGYEKEKSIDNIDERLDFEKALNKLETNIKSIIILKCYLNFTFDEISIILDKPTGTNKTWYYKGIDKLKAIIDAQEGVTNYE